MNLLLFNPDYLAELLHEMPDRTGKSVADLARAIGRDRKTLARELNPGDDGAKLGVATFVLLTAASGDLEPLDYIEHHLGRVAVRLARAADPAGLYSLAGRSCRELGEALDTLLADLADGLLDDPQAVLKEIRDLEQVLAAMKGQVAALAAKR
ncbi:MAG: hypothetical protein KQJ78_14665 [Deltaproteobacteria bacterium]|nr:hypothetical protein [Deltaproteobacteria bacterium]